MGVFIFFKSSLYAHKRKLLESKQKKKPLLLGKCNNTDFRQTCLGNKEKCF